MELGVWKGYRIIGITCEEYRELYQQKKIQENVAYVLLDNHNYVIIDQQVIGYTLNNHRSIKTTKVNMPGWADACGFAKTIITERSTVESLVKEGRDKNKVVIKASPKVEELAAEGEAKLNAIVEEGQVKTASVRKKRRPPIKKLEN